MKYFDIIFNNHYVRTCLAFSKKEALIIARSQFGYDVEVQEVAG